MENVKKILIIDDEENIRNAIKRMVHESMPSVYVIETGNGNQALNIILESQPDLILLDILMPGINGLQVLKDLKKNENITLRKIPVIILTGVKNKEIIFKAMAMGAVDYITKPFNEKVFLLKIKKYIKVSRKSFTEK